MQKNTMFFMAAIVVQVALVAQGLPIPSGGPQNTGGYNPNYPQYGMNQFQQQPQQVAQGVPMNPQIQHNAPQQFLPMGTPVNQPPGGVSGQFQPQVQNMQPQQSQLFNPFPTPVTMTMPYVQHIAPQQFPPQGQQPYIVQHIAPQQFPPQGQQPYIAQQTQQHSDPHSSCGVPAPQPQPQIIVVKQSGEARCPDGNY